MDPSVWTGLGVSGGGLTAVTASPQICVTSHNVAYFVLCSVQWRILPCWSWIIWAPGSCLLCHWLPLSSLLGLTEREVGEGESTELSRG